MLAFVVANRAKSTSPMLELKGNKLCGIYFGGIFLIKDFYHIIDNKKEIKIDFSYVLIYCLISFIVPINNNLRKIPET